MVILQLFEDDDDSASVDGDRKPRIGSSSSHGSRDDTAGQGTDKDTSTKKQDGQIEGEADESSKRPDQTEGMISYRIIR